MDEIIKIGDSYRIDFISFVVLESRSDDEKLRKTVNTFED